MGRSGQEEEARGVGKPRPKKKSVAKGKLVNYQPTEAVKKALREGGFGPLEALELLDQFAGDGVRVSLGGNLERGGYFVIIREPADNWQDALSMSFWASTLARAVTLCGYYLSQVNPDWPDGTQMELFSDDW